MSETEAVRRQQLATMKRRATALLVAVTAAFVALVALAPDAAWVPYAIAAGEGSLVGGLADWFAVTALFRRPLGLPIPHTAIIRERKDQFGATLGGFVQENFLSPEVVTERVRHARVGDRFAAWLTRPDVADALARTAAEGLVALVDLVDDDDVQRLVHDEVSRAIDRLPLAPIAGRALEAAVEGGRHRELVDAVLRGSSKFLHEHREVLRSRFEAQSPWWLPGALEDKLFDRLVDGARLFLGTIIDDPDHEMRRTFDARIVDVARRLREDPAMQERAEHMKRELLEHPELRGWTSSLWVDAKRMLREQAGDPASELRVRAAAMIVGVGDRLLAEPALRDKLTEAAETGARYVAEHYRGEIGDLITATVSRWDGADTSDKLELLLGRDLQFIRINGTIFGGLAGLAIHGLSTAIGG